MNERTSGTFSGFWDRLTYIVTEAQLIVVGLLVMCGVLFIWYQPTIPRVPRVTHSILASLLLLGPPLVGVFVTGARKLRNFYYVTVFEFNGERDRAEKWMVPPGMWSEKAVDGPNPYPLNGGSAWGVREFDYVEETGDLTIKGVWLSEATDVELYTSKRHFKAIHGKLSVSHIALGVFRDSVTEFGADLQRRLINKMAEARERGKMMDPNAIKDVFDNFENDVKDLGADDLPTLEPDGDLPGDVDQLVSDSLEEMETPDQMGRGHGHGRSPAATDGGENQ